MSETNTLAVTRTADTWPRHKHKARRRSSTRKTITREAQARIDQQRNKK